MDDKGSAAQKILVTNDDFRCPRCGQSPGPEAFEVDGEGGPVLCARCRLKAAKQGKAAGRYLLLVRRESAREGCVHVNLIRESAAGTRSGLLYGQMTTAALQALAEATGLTHEDDEPREPPPPAPPPKSPRRRPRAPGVAAQRGLFGGQS